MTGGNPVKLRLAAIVLWASSATYAQETPQTPADASGALEEVTVTAQFVRQNLQDTPVAITAISSARLEEETGG